MNEDDADLLNIDPVISLPLDTCVGISVCDPINVGGTQNANNP